jgi:hypothetical protein
MNIKPLTEEEVAEVKGWMACDKAYKAVYRSMKERAAVVGLEVFRL